MKAEKNLTKSQKKKNRKETQKFATKATFASGIVVTIAILKDTLKIWGLNFKWLSIICGLISIVVMIVILILNMFEKNICSEKGIAIGNYFTVVSLIVFILENLWLDYEENEVKLESKILLTFLNICIITMPLILYKLTPKNN